MAVVLTFGCADASDDGAAGTAVDPEISGLISPDGTAEPPSSGEGEAGQLLYSPLRVEELAAWDGVVTAKVQATDAHVQDRKTYRAHFCELDVVDSLLGPFEPGETLIAACFGSPLDSGQFAGDDVAESTSLPVDEPEVGSQHTYAIVADSFEGPDGPQGDHYGAVPVVIDQPSDAISLAGSDYQGTFDDDAVQSSAATADSDGNSMPWSEFQTMWNSTAGSS